MNRVERRTGNRQNTGARHSVSMMSLKWRQIWWDELSVEYASILHDIQLAKSEVMIDHGGHRENPRIGGNRTADPKNTSGISVSRLFPPLDAYIFHTESPLAFIRIHLRPSMPIPRVPRG